MSFEFRFATLLQLCRRRRDQVGGEVGQAIEAISRVDERMELLRNQRESLRTGSNENRIGNVSVDGLLARGRYDLQLQAELNSLEVTRKELVQELDRRQQVLVEAEAEVKKFERLEEKERTAFQVEQFRREQAEADDASGRRYTIARQR